MAEGSKVWTKCSSCDGSGVDSKFVADIHGTGEPEEAVCSKCGGVKYLFWGWMSENGFTLPENLPEPS